MDHFQIERKLSLALLMPRSNIIRFHNTQIIYKVHLIWGKLNTKCKKRKCGLSLWEAMCVCVCVCVRVRTCLFVFHFTKLLFLNFTVLN